MAIPRKARPRRRVAGLALSVLLVAMAAAQWVGPELPEPGGRGGRPIEEHVEVPPEVGAVLRRACYDCHSSDTRWPLYSRVAPASWLLAKHVREGRASLDFSDWSTDASVEPTPEQRLGGICHDLRKKIMPPPSYRLMHPESALSEDEVRLICGWVDAARRGTPRPE